MAHHRPTMMISGRTYFEISTEGLAPEQAMARLNRSMRGAMKKFRARQKGYMKPSRIKFFNEQKRQYKRSYEKVQKVLAHIELERTLSARVKKETRREEKLRDQFGEDYDKDEYFDAILKGEVPPILP